MGHHRHVFGISAVSLGCDTTCERRQLFTMKMRHQYSSGKRNLRVIESHVGTKVVKHMRRHCGNTRSCPHLHRVQLSVKVMCQHLTPLEWCQYSTAGSYECRVSHDRPLVRSYHTLCSQSLLLTPVPRTSFMTSGFATMGLGPLRNVACCISYTWSLLQCWRCGCLEPVRVPVYPGHRALPLPGMQTDICFSRVKKVHCNAACGKAFPSKTSSVGE
mmetsp:Transcript_4429/g.12765  ORF Transcript_4429/g.12765 Transcript_4429/m.12765 type:complete len:216 (-) Transcript_4429:193-840(-)